MLCTYLGSLGITAIESNNPNCSHLAQRAKEGTNTDAVAVSLLLTIYQCEVNRPLKNAQFSEKVAKTVAEPKKCYNVYIK
jgi:hypothetical protein